MDFVHASGPNIPVETPSSVSLESKTYLNKVVVVLQTWIGSLEVLCWGGLLLGLLLGISVGPASSHDSSDGLVGHLRPCAESHTLHHRAHESTAAEHASGLGWSSLLLRPRGSRVAFGLI